MQRVHVFSNVSLLFFKFGVFLLFSYLFSLLHLESIEKLMILREGCKIPLQCRMSHALNHFQRNNGP